ncbi:hypothetical protein NL676_014965 [Syzygium grande]|nr:hypothetical protein NL676_014965 [Syzygium grande]
MEVYLANLEWYKKKCEDEGHCSGYYDSFKNRMALRDHRAVNFIKPLTVHWERMVEEAEERPQREGAPMRIRWLFAGTNYWRMVEPLHITEYYKWAKEVTYLKGDPSTSSYWNSGWTNIRNSPRIVFLTIRK